MPYVDAPNTKIEIGDMNPRILIVAANLEDEIIKTLTDGAVDGMTSAGVLKENIVIHNINNPIEIPKKTKELIIATRKEALICIGIFIDGEMEDFDSKSMESYNEVLDIIVETNVPCIMGILTCNDYEQGLERAGIGRKVKGANHGYFWATAALSEIKVRSNYCKGISDTSIFDGFSVPSNVKVEGGRNNKNVAILCAQWNMEINSEIVLETVRTLVKNGYDFNNIAVYSASGSFELPGLAKYVIDVSRLEGVNENNRPIDSVVCIGSLIKGGTKHFKFIGDAVEISLEKITSITKIQCVSGVLCCKSSDEAKLYAGIDVGETKGVNIGSKLGNMVG
ncbi:hypothetical protein BB558_004449 [Smittium angustum]|uniref:6,7-dimethyl-8-ribityllumazine synthase n=1 Tax=Smittium angustum TaxID=133377 RepID=A0A2U1J379_SMIAN|nr:hypothetical protein BB558_004449 [Smittium angustum]